MVRVTISEFRDDVERYLGQTSEEQVVITKHGDPLWVLSASEWSKGHGLDSLVGSLEIDEGIEDFIFKKRMEDYESLG